jgi:hypothetical protein
MEVYIRHRKIEQENKQQNWGHERKKREGKQGGREKRKRKEKIGEMKRGGPNKQSQDQALSSTDVTFLLTVMLGTFSFLLNMWVYSAPNRPRKAELFS